MIKASGGVHPRRQPPGRAAGMNPAARLEVAARLELRARLELAAHYHDSLFTERVMNSDRPFALHITWTCYGTWLPGDRRGYVSNTLLPRCGWEPKENTPGTPYRANDPYTRSVARRLQKGPSVWLTGEQAWQAAEALVRTAHTRGWRIVRAALMPNHIHVVIAECPDDGPAVRRILKGVSQAALSKHLGHSQRWWTAGGSDRYKHDAAAIQAAVQYVANQEGKLVGHGSSPVSAQPNGGGS
jgi:REP element-mobilizing transposase RayT